MHTSLRQGVRRLLKPVIAFGSYSISRWSEQRTMWLYSSAGLFLLHQGRLGALSAVACFSGSFAVPSLDAVKRKTIIAGDTSWKICTGAAVLGLLIMLVAGWLPFALIPNNMTIGNTGYVAFQAFVCGVYLYLRFEHGVFLDHCTRARNAQALNLFHSDLENLFRVAALAMGFIFVGGALTYLLRYADTESGTIGLRLRGGAEGEGGISVHQASCVLFQIFGWIFWVLKPIYERARLTREMIMAITASG